MMLDVMQPHSNGICSVSVSCWEKCLLLPRALTALELMSAPQKEAVSSIRI